MKTRKKEVHIHSTSFFHRPEINADPGIISRKDLLLTLEKFADHVAWDDIFLIGISAGLGVFYCADYFGQGFALTPVAVSCYGFLCHDTIYLKVLRVCLLDLFVDRIFLENGIVFLQFHPSRGVFPVLGGNIPGGTRLPRFLVLCTLQNNLNPVSLRLFCHNNLILEGQR